MGFDMSALAPGPAGTVMIGERGGAEAVVLRARARRQQEGEQARREGLNNNDMGSGTTAAEARPQRKSVLHSRPRFYSQGEHDARQSQDPQFRQLGESEPYREEGYSEKRASGGGIRGRWREFRRSLM